ncbi:MAG: serine hydrolase [Planctomycetota bacterium]
MERLAPSLFVLLVTTALPLARAQEADSPPSGHWEGRIEGAGLDFDVDLAWKDGALVGDLSIPAQRLRDHALSELTFEDGAVGFLIGGVPGDPRFAGVLDEAGDRIEGTFTQGGLEFEFWLAASATTSQQAAERLADLDEWMAAELKRFRVPGATIAVVWRGETVLAKGYGKRDAEKDLPVTADTLFAIGSTTKAFTTFVLAQAVEEGLLDWDEPVVTWIPELDLWDDYAERHITLRDMCSHRSGLPRHDLLWYLQPDLSREELVARLAHLEPSAGFREKWQYNNLMFLTAGHVLERVTGKSWEQNVRERVLDPLGMTNTAFGPREAATRADFAVPHDRKRGKDVVIPFRDLTAIGPAGSIHSSANDMARWLAMLLAQGEYGGGRLLPAAALLELATPVSVIPTLSFGDEAGPTAYGLGWMIDTVQGRLRVHHGGGIDGFVTEVELYPNDDLGIFVATDRASALPSIAAAHLAERLLGLEERDRAQIAAAQTEQVESIVDASARARARERVADAPPAHELAEYAATYAHPSYGRIEVGLGEGVLEMRYGTVVAPLEHRHFEVFAIGESESGAEVEGLELQFVGDLAGHVTRLEVRLEPSVAPIVFERAPDARLSDPAFLARLVGAYELPALRIDVSLEGTRLAMDVSGQGRFTLEPSTFGRFTSPQLEGYAVRFDFDDEAGPASTIVLLQPNGTFRAKRVAAPEPSDRR